MIASNAGGSGKTTMAVHLAYLLGNKGYRVVIVELDHNGSLSTLAGLEAGEPSLASVLSKDFDGNYPLIPLWDDRLSSVFAIPGGDELEGAIKDLYQNNRRHYILGDRLEDFPIDADLLIFDTPASLEPMGLVALAASSHILAPIKPEYKDAGALAGLFRWYYDKVSELRLKPQPEFMGFVPSRVNLDVAIHRNLLGLTEKGARNPKVPYEDTLIYQIEQIGITCFPHIRESSYYLQASGAGLPLPLYRPGLTYGDDYNPIVSKVIELMEAK